MLEYDASGVHLLGEVPYLKVAHLDPFGVLAVAVEVDLHAAEALAEQVECVGGVRLPGDDPGVFAAEVQGGVHAAQVPQRADDVDGREDGVVPAGLRANEDAELGPGVLVGYPGQLCQVGVGVDPGECDQLKHVAFSFGWIFIVRIFSDSQDMAWLWPDLQGDGRGDGGGFGQAP